MECGFSHLSRAEGRCLLVFATLVFLLMATFTQAQVQTGTITGTVTDSTGAVVAGATAKAVDLATNQEFTATSSTNGEFVINNVRFGFYRVSVMAKGFGVVAIDRIQVDVGQTAHVNVKLEIAPVGTVMEVSGAQAVVQTETVEIAHTIDRKQVMDLPLPTRNPLDLVNTMAGMAKVSNGGTNDTFVHGLRGNSTNVMQDGINVADNYVKTSSFFALSAPTVDTIGEFSVSVSGSSTNAGFGAAQVNMATQRGQNDLHGSLLWFQRNSFLNANTYFNNANNVPTPFQLQNRIGYGVGGPVVIPKIYHGKNKTFFYNAFEAFREPVARARPRLVMSDLARTGMFSYKAACDNKTASTMCPTGITPGQTMSINLLSIGTIGATGTTPAINSAYMSYYNSLVPSPNADAGCSGGDGVNLRCFAWNVPGFNFQNRYTARIDHNFTDRESLEFVYNQANYRTSNDFLNAIEQYFPKSPGGGQESKRQVFTWALHSTLTATKANTLRFGLTRAPVTFVIKDNFAGTSGLQVALPNSYSLLAAGTWVEPSIVSTNLPQGRSTPVRQITDTFGWVRGNHNWQFAGEWRWILADNFMYNTIPQLIQLGNNTANPDGIVASKFPGGISSGDLTNASRIFDAVTGLLGSTSLAYNMTSPTSGFVPGTPRVINPSQNNFAFSFQDNWKFRPNLTVQYGLRWEYQGPFDLRNKLILQPDDRLGAVFGPAGVNNYFTPVTTPAATDVLLNLAGGNNGNPLYNKQYRDFAPLLGFAWDPFNDGKTAVRGGFGMHFVQDGFTLFAVSSTGNLGLFTTVANNVPTGVFNPSAPPALAQPTAAFPVSQKANFTANTGANLWSFKRDLSVPYVMEWNLALQREVGKRITIEARYIGNRAVKLYRSSNINEINLLNDPFTDRNGNSVPNLLTEFNNAVNNLAICQANATACKAAQTSAGVVADSSKGIVLTQNNFGYWRLPGQVPLPVLAALFAGFSGGSSSGFANSGFVTNLTPSQGLNPGTMFDSLRRSNTYAANRAAFPLNYFVPNPWANQSILVDNSSYSTYNGLEMEVRRRFSSGLFLVANYTFSKTLGDSRFLSSQQEQQSYRSLANRALDKSRAAFDVTHNISATFIYPLPIGRGQKFLAAAGGAAQALLGGWNLQGMSRWNTGAPFNLVTGRNPTGQVQQSETPVLRNMSMSDFMSYIGTFKSPLGVYWLDPRSGLFTISGASSKPVICTANQTTPCFDYSAPGQLGGMPFLGFNGPVQFNQDLSVIKRTNISKISEQFNFEIRLEAFNVFNHPNFQTPTTNSLQSTQFGQLTTSADSVRGGGVTSRIVQWGLRVNF